MSQQSLVKPRSAAVVRHRIVVAVVDVAAVEGTHTVLAMWGHGMVLEMEHHLHHQ